MTKHTARRVIESLTRLKNSTNGNPRYRVTFADGTSANTATDHGFTYSLTGNESGAFLVTVGGRGTITDISPLTYEDHKTYAAQKAGLGVGHVWTATQCPAYRTYAPSDCTCNA